MLLPSYNTEHSCLPIGIKKIANNIILERLLCENRISEVAKFRRLLCSLGKSEIDMMILLTPRLICWKSLNCPFSSYLRYRILVRCYDWQLEMLFSKSKPYCCCGDIVDAVT